MNNKEQKTCVECQSNYFKKSSEIINLCPNCAHKFYGYPNCEHSFKNGNCIKCGWNEKSSKFIKNQGSLIYDTELETTEVDSLKIEKGELSDLEALFQIYINGKHELERHGIYQWTDKYPTRSIIENDLIKSVLYVLKNNNELIGAINISEEQEIEYQLIDWEFDNSKTLVIHRLVINPKHQKKGYAKQLMAFAEYFAKEHHYTSIRLDVYSQNQNVIAFYKSRNYFIRGNVNFPGRKYPFHCMEKEITTKTTA